MYMRKVMMPQGQIVNKRQTMCLERSWIEKVTRRARCAKVDVVYGHINQERDGIPRKQI